MADVRARLGALQAMEHVGTSPRGGRAFTTVRLRFERGTQLLRLAGQAAAVTGVAPMREPPPAAFVPVAPGRVGLVRLRHRRHQPLRFEGGALVVETPSGPVRATLSQSASEIKEDGRLKDRGSHRGKGTENIAAVLGSPVPLREPMFRTADLLAQGGGVYGALAEHDCSSRALAGLWPAK